MTPVMYSDISGESASLIIATGLYFLLIFTLSNCEIGGESLEKSGFDADFEVGVFSSYNFLKREAGSLFGYNLTYSNYLYDNEFSNGINLRVLSAESSFFGGIDIAKGKVGFISEIKAKLGSVDKKFRIDVLGYTVNVTPSFNAGFGFENTYMMNLEEGSLFEYKFERTMGIGYGINFTVGRS